MPHAPFPPSSAKRWINCPGSFALGLQRPEPPDSEYAAEGGRLHGVAALVLNDHAETRATLDAVAPTDTSFLKSYLDYATARMAKASAYAIEETIHHSDMLFGTPDLLLYYKAEGLLEIVDLKCGAGILVDPVENEQAMTYAYMALARMQKDLGLHPPHVRITIVQPPDEDDQIKIWDTSASRIFEHGKKCEAAIKAALAGGADIVPGDWCRFCKAKSFCPALRGEVIEALSDVPKGFTLQMIAQWLDRADRLDAWIGALREMAHKAASESIALGKPGIPGYVLKPKRATRVWKSEEEVLVFARRRRIKIWQDKLMSPAMAEKVHPNMPQELKDMIVAVSSGTNLVKSPPGEAPALPDLKPEASKIERLMANFELAKYRS
jgi:uncharacterized protein DUF2800